jgi:predicted nucleic acid-binding protein
MRRSPSRLVRDTQHVGYPSSARAAPRALRRQALRRSVGAEQAAAALAHWARLGLRRFAVVGLLGRIWELRENLSAYDASYVALAEALACELLTADARLARSPGPRCAITVVRR